MKKISLILLSMMLAVSMAACGESKTKVVLNGSSSVTPLMMALAAAYEQANTGVRIEVQQTDSGTGINKAIDGTAEIGMVSRGLKSGEDGVTVTTIATDGVVLIVSKETELSNVTNEQVYDMYVNLTAIGSVTKAMSREDGSGTRGAFDELIKNSEGKALKDAKLHGSVEIQNSTGAILSEIQKTDNKIAYISLGSLNNTVKALNFNGEEATADNIRNGNYKLSRPFNLVTKKGATISAAAQKFIDFILSEQGQKIVEDEGYIKVK